MVNAGTIEMIALTGILHSKFAVIPRSSIIFLLYTHLKGMCRKPEKNGGTK